MTAKVGPATLDKLRALLHEQETSVTCNMLAGPLGVSPESTRRALRILREANEVVQARSGNGGQCPVLYHLRGRELIRPAGMPEPTLTQPGAFPIPPRDPLMVALYGPVPKGEQPCPA